MTLSPQLQKRLITSVSINIGLAAFLLFFFAGTFNWWRGWVLIGAFLLIAILSIYGLRNHEDLLKERLKSPIQPGQPLIDKALILLFIFSYLLYFISIPLDRFKWHFLPIPSLWVSSLGMALILLGSWVIFLALRENAFAIPVVRLQEDRHQHVIDTGVYRLVRHPMYAGFVLFLLGIPLWLESYTGTIAALIPIGFLMIRIIYEEKFLQKKLKGYKSYMTRVPYRIVPYLW